MSEKFKLLLKTPSQCDVDELDAFFSLVILGDEVDERGLERRIKMAKLLVFCYEQNFLIGIGALKHPTLSHKNSVFKNAGFEEKEKNFALELGWVFVKKEYEHRGIGTRIVVSLLNTRDNNSVFSTTRTNNLGMKKILRKNFFKQIGQPYPGRKENQFIELFIRI